MEIETSDGRIENVPGCMEQIEYPGDGIREPRIHCAKEYGCIHNQECLWSSLTFGNPRQHLVDTVPERRRIG